MSRKDYIEVGDALRFLKKTSPFQEDWDRITDKVVMLFQKNNPGFDKQRFRDYIDR